MQTQRQFVRYAVIGIVSNVTLYLIYISLTREWLQPRMAMTIMYSVGVLATFLFNRNWTFAYTGSRQGPLIRYLVVYALGYIVNLVLLSLLVDTLGYPHEIVQAVLILFLAIAIFLAQKLWVFDHRIKD